MATVMRAKDSLFSLPFVSAMEEKKGIFSIKGFCSSDAFCFAEYFLF